MGIQMFRLGSISRLFTIVSLMLLSLASNAQELDKRFYIAPGLTYTIFDNDTNVEDDLGFHIAFGKPVSRHFNIELQAGYLKSHTKDTSGLGELSSFGADLLFFPKRSDLALFGLLGYMSTDFEIDGPANTKIDQSGDILDVGIGLLQQFSAHGTAARWEYRYRQNKGDTQDFDDHVLMLSLQVPLGAAPVTPEPPPPPPPPRPIVKAPPEPAPAPVLPEPVIVLQGVHFEFDSSALTPEATTILSNTAVTLRELTDLSTIAIGHTCNIGEETYNDKLSLDRANSVRDFLMSRGIDGDRLKVKGYGESMPIADNATKEGRKLNRRVEISVISDAICLPPREGDETDANGCAIIK